MMTTGMVMLAGDEFSDFGYLPLPGGGKVHFNDWVKYKR